MADDFPIMTALGYAPVFHPKTGNLSGFQNTFTLTCVAVSVKGTWLAFDADIPSDASVLRRDDHKFRIFPSATSAARYLRDHPSYD